MPRMSGAGVQTMSLDEFLAWEREQPDRWEFDAGVTTMMTGVSLDHGTIAGNLHAELRQLLRGTRCRAFAGDNKILPAGRNRGYYPDGSVTCSPISDGNLTAFNAIAEAIAAVAPGTSLVLETTPPRNPKYSPVIAGFQVRTARSAA